MSIRGVMLQPSTDQCPYITENLAVNENILVAHLETRDLEIMLSLGYRHFGAIFFRPLCSHCRKCISLRIPVRDFKASKSVRRLYNRNKNLRVTLENPVPSQELYQLYLRHKKRFDHPAVESYDLYLKSFFHPFPFNRMLRIRDGDHTVAVAHLDVTANIMSAIYCYFDEDYARHSPGKFAVYEEIRFAREMGVSWLYLGYYVQENRHTRYKIDFRPNQLLTLNMKWADYLDADGNIVTPFTFP